MKVITVFVCFTALSINLSLKAQTLLDSAINSLESKKYDQAIKYAEQYLKSADLDAASKKYALFSIARGYEKKRSPSKAIDHYLKALEVFYDANLNAKIYYNVGLLYNNFHLYDQAIGCFNLAFQLNTNETFEGSILVYRAIAYKYSAKYDSALIDALAVQNLAFEDLENRKWLLYKSYNQQGLISKALKDYDEAVRFFELANDLQVGKNTLVNIGSTYQARGDYRRAIDIYQAALGSKQNSDQRFKTYQKLGEAYAEMDMNNDSYTFLIEAEAIYPEILYPDVDDIDVYSSLAESCKKTGRSAQYSLYLETGYALQRERNKITDALLLEANKQKILSTVDEHYARLAQEKKDRENRFLALAGLVVSLLIIGWQGYVRWAGKKAIERKKEAAKAYIRSSFQRSSSNIPDELIDSQ